MYLPQPAKPPTEAALQQFCAAAMAAVPGLQLTTAQLEPRWIGLDAATTHSIFELICSGDKRGTFTLPWIVERTGSPRPAVGNYLVLIDLDGSPVLLLRITRIDEAIFGDVRAEHTAVDGSPVRDPKTWVTLHTQYWNTHLKPFGLEVSAEMPFWIEEFTLLFDSRSTNHER